MTNISATTWKGFIAFAVAMTVVSLFLEHIRMRQAVVLPAIRGSWLDTDTVIFLGYVAALGLVEAIFLLVRRHVTSAQNRLFVQYLLWAVGGALAGCCVFAMNVVA